ncbi:MAG: hypothetical protein CMJ49_13860 [Planctomycetaceae bacterium]|nr:hypothetical protein [Planctomycetaceae bacterium]
MRRRGSRGNHVNLLRGDELIRSVQANRTYRALREGERAKLIGQGCSAQDWSGVMVADGFSAGRVRDVHFNGAVKIGKLTGEVGETVRKCAGLFGAWIGDCVIGDDVRIANVGGHVANYDIGDGALIEDVGRVETNPGATFGHGVRVRVLNEGGGREVVLFDELNAQFAYLMCMYRYRPGLVARLEGIAARATAAAKSDRGRIGAGAVVRGVARMVDVNIGDGAVVEAATSLVNGTVLSDAARRTTIGAGVGAADFVIAEGASVLTGAMVDSSYVGQGCCVEHGFSLSHSLMFAHSHAAQGEGCSWFCGPFGVTHHKSSLLVAVATSFLNVGSGTNQSNHMYKVGAVHEGRLERGVKTGSDSYLIWPSRLGAFSTVLGRHTRSIDTSVFPFSLVMGTAEGKSRVAPGFNVSRIGHARHEAGWLECAAGRGARGRDRISGEVFGPYTVGRMIEAAAELERLDASMGDDEATTTVGGAELTRDAIEKGRRFYAVGIEMYLLEQVVARLEAGAANGETVAEALETADGAAAGDAWVDVGGLVMGRARLDGLCGAIESGAIADVDGFFAALDGIERRCREDAWAWVKRAYASHAGADLDAMDDAAMGAMAQRFLKARGAHFRAVLEDAAKDFDEGSRVGYGQDGDATDAAADFEAVRGTLDDNPQVARIVAAMADLDQRIDALVGAGAEA